MMKAIIYASIGEYDESEQCSRQASDLAQSITTGLTTLIAAEYGRGLVQNESWRSRRGGKSPQ